MASEEQISLSTYIKDVHSKLRENAKIHGPTVAWELHCKENAVLHKYSENMKKLATYWDNNAPKNSSSCRVEWSYNQCVLYFETGLEYQRNRELDILNKMNTSTIDFPIYEHSSKISLLDVGSCYNPFKKYDIFDVTAIDLCPASEDVMSCDFIKLECVEKNTLDNTDSEIVELKTGSFDVVIFSLFLEYLPSSEQRIVCCKKAYTLLKREGILIIITPDSKHVGANAKLMKSWRYVLACMGFMRIKYEKLRHIHCMIFRKCLNASVSERWASMHQTDSFCSQDLNIPQDFQENHVEENTKTENEHVEHHSLFVELPYE